MSLGTLLRNKELEVFSQREEIQDLMLVIHSVREGVTGVSTLIPGDQ